MDGFGRRIDYVRFSVTDRCDFRCVYCMSEQMTFVPRAQILTLEELVTLGQAFVDLGFKLGFGGAMTFERALQLRRLAQSLPRDAIVLETDAPDIPPQWLYRTAAQRQAEPGAVARNEPAQLVRIAETLAELRGASLAEIAGVTWVNAHEALPKLKALA